MTKFETNGVAKQNEAYLVGYSEKCFNYSCVMCAEKGLDSHRHGCVNCPIRVAHDKAIMEIKEGKRERPKPFGYGGAFKRTNNKGNVTIVLRFDNCKFNIDTKEEKK